MDAMFSPVETKRAYDAVYEQIENMILSGQLKPGDKLPSERELMTLYKRSHPTIREALRMLEASDYIRVIPGGCAEVCYSNTESMQDSVTELLQFRQVPFEDIYQFAKLSEPEFCRQTAEHHTWEDMLELESLLKEMAACMDSIPAYSARMFLFHLGLMKATHNPLVYVFWNCTGTFWSEENLCGYAGSICIRDMAALQDAHAALLQAIRDKDADRSAALVQKCWDEWRLRPNGSGKGGAA